MSVGVSARHFSASLYWSVLTLLAVLSACIFFGDSVDELWWQHDRSEPIRRTLGFRAAFVEIPYWGSRFVVTAVEPDGAFARAGLLPGDGMLCGSEQVICRPVRFYERLDDNRGRTITILVRNLYKERGERKVQLTLPPSWRENPNSPLQPTGAQGSE